MYGLRQKIWFWAIYTRLLILSLQVVLGLMIPDFEHDTSNEFVWQRQDRRGPSVQNEEVPEKEFDYESVVVPDTTANQHVDPFKDMNLTSTVMDTLRGGRGETDYYLHIANSGYTYESCLVFMPFYPLLVRMTADGLDSLYNHDLDWLTAWIPFTSLIQFSSIVINFFIFILANDRLYMLSRRVLKDEYLAYKSALFFAISPASILMASPVPDAVVASAAFAAFNLIEKVGLCVWSGIYLALATASSVAGIPTGLLYVMYSSMRTVSKETILLVRNQKQARTVKTGKSTQPEVKKVSMTDTVINITLSALLPGLWNIVLVVAPFGAMQWFAHATFCKSEAGKDQQFLQHKLPKEVAAYGKEHNLLMPYFHSKEAAEWCSLEPPVSYPNVAFKYWKTKDFMHTFFNSNEEWPFIIQALPIYALLLWQMRAFFVQNTRFCIRFGLIDNAQLGLAKIRQMRSSYAARSLSRDCFVYMIHALGLLIFGAFFVPVQIAVRLLLCSSPVIYWIAALTTTPSENKLVPIQDTSDEVAPDKVEKPKNLESLYNSIILQENPSDDIGNWVKLYFLVGMFVGTVLHVNQYTFLL